MIVGSMRVCGGYAVQPADTLSGKIVEYLRIQSSIDREAIVELVVAIEQFRQVGGKFVDRECLVRLVVLHRSVNAFAAAEPCLHLEVTGANVKRVRRLLVLRIYDGYSIRLRNPVKYQKSESCRNLNSVS